MTARREPLHPGAQLTIDDIDSRPVHRVLTDRPGTDLALSDVRHRTPMWPTASAHAL